MITQTKRDFLGLSVAGLATAAGGMAPALLSAAQRATTATAFSTAEFKSVLNTAFSVGTAAGKQDQMALVNVSAGPVSPHTEQFSITFKGPQGHKLPEGTYDITHPDMGRFQLYVQPVLADGSASYYRSAFSLIRPGFRAG